MPARRVGERDRVADVLAVARLRTAARGSRSRGRGAAAPRGAGRGARPSSSTRRTWLRWPLARWAWRGRGIATRWSCVGSRRAGPRHSYGPARRGTGAGCPGRTTRCPRPRWAASRWTIVSGRGTSSGWWVAAARSAARWWVAETCIGCVRRRGGARGRRRSVSSSQRTSAWPPFSCGRMYGTVCSVDGRLVDGHEPAALPIGVRLVRAGPEPADRLEPGHDLEDGPDARQVGERRREVDRLLDARTRRPADGVIQRSWRMTWPPPVVTSSTMTDRVLGVASGRRRDVATLEAVEARRRPTPRPSRRCGRCRSGRATGRGRRARRGADGGASRRRRRPAPSVGRLDGDVEIPAARRARADRHLQRRRSRVPAGAHDRRPRSSAAGGQPGVARTRAGCPGMPSSGTDAVSPGPIGGAGYGAARRDARRRSRPPTSP